MKELNIDIEKDSSPKYPSTWYQYNAICQEIVSKSDPVKDYVLIPAINLLEYQVAVYGIYIERYMNPKWKLTKVNIEIKEKYIMNIMQFFYNWCYSEVQSKRGGEQCSRTLESKYIAEQTHHNMNVLCKGLLSMQGIF